MECSPVIGGSRFHVPYSGLALLATSWRFHGAGVFDTIISSCDLHVFLEQIGMSGEQESCRFRWRFIPATILILFGAVMSVSSIAWLSGEWLLAANGAAKLTASQRGGGILIAMAGAVWLASGLFLRNGKWWRAGFSLIVRYIGGVLGSYLAFPNAF